MATTDPNLVPGKHRGYGMSLEQIQEALKKEGHVGYSAGAPTGSQTFNVNMDSYTRYMTEVRPHLNIDLQRAESQPWLHQAANAVFQAAGSIVGDTLTGFGALGEIGSYAVDGKQDFDNALMRLGESISEGAREAAPIYRQNQGASFDVGDFGWWASMFPSMVSTVSMMVPGMAVAKGLSLAGKMGRAMKLTNGLSKVAKATAGAAGAADAAIAGKAMTDFAKALTKTAVAAGVTRNAENFREAHDIYAEAHADILEQSKTEEGWDRLNKTVNMQEAREHFGSEDVTPEQYAEYTAAKGAWRSYKINSANYVFDFAQFAIPFMKGKNLFSRTPFKTGKEALVIKELAGHADDAAKLTKLEKFRYSLGPSSTLGFEMGTEAVEEAINFVGSTTGRNYIAALNGNKDLFAVDSLREYLTDGHMWESAALGAVGGGVFAGIGHIAQRDQRAEAVTSRINSMRERVAEIGSLRAKLASIEANSKMTPVQKERAINTILRTDAFSVGVRSAMTGTVGHMLDIINDPLFKENLSTSLGLTPAEFSERHSSLVAGINEGEASFNKNAGFFTRPDLSPLTSAILAQDAIRSENQRREFEIYKAEASKEVDRLSALVPEGDKSVEGFSNSIDMSALTEAYSVLMGAKRNAIESAKVSAKDGKLSPKEVEAHVLSVSKHYDDMLKAVKDKVDKLAKGGVSTDLLISKKHSSLTKAKRDLFVAQESIDALYRTDQLLRSESYQKSQEAIHNKEESRRRAAEKAAVQKAAEEAPNSEDALHYEKDPDTADAITASRNAGNASKEQEERILAAQDQATPPPHEDPPAPKTSDTRSVDILAALNKGKEPAAETPTSPPVEKFPEPVIDSPREPINSLQERAMNPGDPTHIPNVVPTPGSVPPDRDPVAPKRAAKGSVQAPKAPAPAPVRAPVNAHDDTVVAGEFKIFDVVEGLKLDSEGNAGVGFVDALSVPQTGLTAMSTAFKLRSGDTVLLRRTKNGNQIGIYSDGVLIGFLKSEKMDVSSPMVLLRNAVDVSESGITVVVGGISNGGTKMPGTFSHNVGETMSEYVDKFGFYIPSSVAGRMLVSAALFSDAIIKSSKDNNADAVYASNGVFVVVEGFNGALIPVRLNAIRSRDVVGAQEMLTEVVTEIIGKLSNDARKASPAATKLLDSLKGEYVVGKRGINMKGGVISMTFAGDSSDLLNRRLSVSRSELGDLIGLIEELDPETGAVLSKKLLLVTESEILEAVKDAAGKMYIRQEFNKLNLPGEVKLFGVSYPSYNDFLKKHATHNLSYINTGMEKIFVSPHTTGHTDIHGNPYYGPTLSLEIPVEHKPKDTIESLERVSAVKPQPAKKAPVKTKTARPAAPELPFDDSTAPVSLDDGLALTADGTQVTDGRLADLDLMETEWRKMFPHVPFNRVKGLIAVGGERAFGLFANSAVYLSNMAIPGTHYHEAFHTAMHLYLSAGQRAAIYKEGRGIVEQMSSKSYKERLEALNIKYVSPSELTDLQVEEFLAERFRSKMISGEISLTEKPTTAIGRWFQTLLKWIKDLKNLVSPRGTFKTDALFTNIRSGSYNYEATPQMIAHANRMSASLPVPGFTHIEKSEVIHNLTPLMHKAVDAVRGNWKNLQSGEYTFAEQVKRSMLKYLYGLSVTGDVNEVGYDVENIQRVMDKFEDGPDYVGFFEETKKRYEHFGHSLDLISTVVSNKEYTQEEFDAIFDGVSDLLLQNWEDSKDEYDAKRNASSKVRTAIFTTPDLSEWDYHLYNGDHSVYKVTSKDAHTTLFGTVAFVDFDSTYRYLQDHLVGSTSSADLKKRLFELSESRPAMGALWLKLEKDQSLASNFFSEFGKQVPSIYRRVLTGGELKITQLNKAHAVTSLYSSWRASMREFDKFPVGDISDKLTMVSGTPKELGRVLGKSMSWLGLSFGKRETSAGDALTRALSIPYKKWKGGNEVARGEYSSMVNKLIKAMDTIYSSKDEAKVTAALMTLSGVLSKFDAASGSSTYRAADGTSKYGIMHRSQMSDFFDMVNDPSREAETIAYFVNMLSDPRAVQSRWVRKFVSFEMVNGNPVNVHINPDARGWRDSFSYGLSLGIEGEFEGLKDSKLGDSDYFVNEFLSFFSGDTALITHTTPNSATFVVAEDRMGWQEVDSALEDAFIGEILAARRVAEALFVDITAAKLKLKPSVLSMDADSLSASLAASGVMHRDVVVNKTTGEFELLGSDGKPLGNIFKSQLFDTPDFFGLTLSNGIPAYPTRELLDSALKSALGSFEAEVSFVKSKLTELSPMYPALRKYTKNMDWDIELFVKQQKLHAFEKAVLFTGHATSAKSTTDFFKRSNNTTSMGIGLDPSVSPSEVRVMVGQDVVRPGASTHPEIPGKPLTSPMGIALEASGVPIKEIPGIIENFQNINAQDAQGYITLKRYKDILVGRGQWDSRWEELFKKVENGEYIHPRYLTKFLTPIKASFNGLVKDPLTGLMEMHHIKYSAVPLIPGFVTADSDLEALKKHMEANNIDEYVPLTGYKLGATNVNPVHIEDETGGDNSRMNPAALSSLHVQTLPQSIYKVLMDVPAKLLNAKAPLGAQISKLVLGNLNMDGVYTVAGIQMSGRELFDTYNAKISEWVEIEFDKLMKEIGGAVEFDGSFALTSLDKLSEILSKELDRADASDVLREAVTLGKDGRFILPLYYPGIRGKMESLFTSLFTNRLVNLKTSGTAAVQVSSVGFDSADFRRPTIKFNEDGGIAHAEIYLPRHLSYKFMKDGVPLSIKEIEKIDPQALKILGFRVPTESKSSAIVLKVIGFLPDTMGNTVVVPDELITMMGGDFDLDKLFMQYWNNDKDPSRAQTLQNDVFTIFEAVLTNPVNTKEMLSPQNPDRIQKAARALASQDALNISDPYSFTTKLELRSRDRAGAEMIGIGANFNTFAVVAQTVRMHLDEGFPITYRRHKGESSTDFKARSKSLLQRYGVDATQKGGIVTVTHKNLGFTDKDFNGADGKSILDTVRQFVAAAADNTKDPLFGFFNGNNETIDTILTMVLTGIPMEDVFAMSSAPFVREYISLLQDTKSKLGKYVNPMEEFLKRKKLSFDIKRSFSSIDALLEALKVGVPEISAELIADSTANLYSSFIPARQEGAEYQAYILQQFLKFKKISADVAIGTRVFKLDNRATGSKIANSQAIVHDIKNLRDSGLRASSMSAVEAVYPRFLGMRHKSAYPLLETVLMSAHLPVITGLQDYTLTESVDGRDLIYGILQSLNKRSDVATLEDVKESFNMFMMSTDPFFNLDPAPTMGNKMGKGVISVPLPIEEFKNLSAARQLQYVRRHIPEYRSATGYHILGRLSTEFNAVSPDLIRYQVSSDTLVKNEVSESFTEMYNSSNPFVKHLVESLIRYNYFTSGMAFGGRSYSDIIAPSVLLDATRISNLDSFRGSLESYADTFMDFYVTSDPKRAPKVPHETVFTEGKFSLESTRKVLSPYYYSAKAKTLYKKVSEDWTGASYAAVLPISGVGVFKDPTAVVTFRGAQESRDLYDSAVNAESTLTTEEKVDKLTKTFAAVGITVEVVLDDTMDARGKVETVGERSVVLTLNPNKVLEDTVIHEFGHIFIDLLGEDSAIVREGFEQLRGSDLWNKVAARYPELSGVALAKEVLVTAIGREGAQMFNETRTQTKWQTWLNKFFRAIGKLFGVEPSVARTLAREMLSGSIQRPLTGDLDIAAQYQKNSETVGEFRDNIRVSVARLVHQYGETNLPSLGRLLKDLDNAENAIIYHKVNEFLETTLESISNALSLTTEEFKNDPSKLDDPVIRMTYFNFLHSSILSLGGFDNLSSLREEWADTDTDRELIESIHSKAPKVRRTLAALSEATKKVLEKELARHSTNPAIISGAASVLNYIAVDPRDVGGYDETGKQLHLDSLADTNVPLVATAMAMYKTRDSEHAMETKKILLEWEEFVAKNKQYFDSFLEVDSNGARTGRYVNKRSRQYARTIAKNPDMVAAYNYIMNIMTDSVRHTSNAYVSRGYIPAVPTETMADVKRRALSSINRDDINDTVDLDEDGNVIGVIPMAYASYLSLEEEGAEKILPTDTKAEVKAKKTRNRARFLKTHAEKLDYNIADTIPLFIQSARKHKFKSEIHSAMSLVGQQLRTMNFKKHGGAIDKIAGRALGNENRETVLGKDANITKHYNHWMRMIFYEDFDQSSPTASKVASYMLNYMSFTGIGFNAYSAINNRIYGGIMLAVEAAAGEHFSKSAFLRAKKLYNGNMIYMFSHRGDKLGSNNKVAAIIKYMDIMESQDELLLRAGGPAKSALEKWLWVKNLAYSGQRAGEHLMQNEVLLAKLISTEVIVNGKPTTLYDALNVKDGVVTVSPGTMFNKQVSDGNGGIKTELVPFETTNLARVRVATLALNQYLHGIYNRADANIIQRYALGRLAMQFRKWAVPGWNKRFGSVWGKKYWNEQRASMNEGMYITAYNFAKDLITSGNITMSNAKLRWETLSPQEKANMNRTLMEIVYLVGVIGLAGLIAGIEDEEDPVLGRIYASIVYQTDRTKTELLAYTPPGWISEGKKLMSSPIPSISRGETALKMLQHVVSLDVFEPEEAFFKGGRYYGERKISIWTKSMTPILGQWDRIYYIQNNAKYYKLFNF